MLPSQIAASIQKQTTNLLTTGQRFKRFDKVRQRHFWSKHRLVPDVNGYVESGKFEFFQTPVGQKGQGFPFQLTPLETNWPSANRVPDNINLIVTEFGVSCQTPDLELEFESADPMRPTYRGLNLYSYPGAENQILESAVLSIVYLTNEVELGLATDFAQASGPTWGFYAPNMPQSYPLPTSPNPAPTDSDRTLITNGFPAPALRRKLKIPIMLQHGEEFKMNLVIPAGRGPFMWPNIQNTPHNFAWDIRVDFWATESFVE